MPASPSAIRLLGVDFAILNLRQVVNAINARPADAPFAYAVTPTADHLVRLSRDPAIIQPLYQGAWLRLLDSRVVGRLARLFGLSTPPVVPGSDLTAMLVRGAAVAGERVTIIGLSKEQAQALAIRTGLQFCHHCPALGFERDAGAFATTMQFVEDNPARLVFLAVGSPQQEMLAQALVARGIATGMGLCVGASLRFLAGAERRAPVLVQWAGLEWAWRLAQDPRRLWRRYLVDDLAVLQLLWREARGQHGIWHGRYD